MRSSSMIFDRINNVQRKIMSYDQSKLEERNMMKSEGGALLGLGIFLFIFGIGYQPSLGLFKEKIGITQWIITSGVLLLGAICCCFGIKVMGKFGDTIAETVCKMNGNYYTVEEIYDYYREIREGDDVIFFRADKSITTERNRDEAGVLTEHWIKMPRHSTIAKLSDVVAAWHDAKGHTGYGFMGLYLLRSDGTLCGMDCHEDFSRKVIEEIANRNPMTILARRFNYEGNTYDVCSNKEQVIQIYKQNMVKAIEAIKQS